MWCVVPGVFPDSYAVAQPSLMEAQILAVHDGDTVTLLIQGTRKKTRLIGIDAPEMGQRPWGKKSQKYLLALIQKEKKQVLVETDIVPYDKYNRLLAYVWTTDGSLINECMIRDGYALLFTIQPNTKYMKRFQMAQKTARREKRGIWGVDGLRETPRDYKKMHPRE
ncbi:MAG: thermonuclease family protein [Nitrospirota bacterium]